MASPPTPYPPTSPWLHLASRLGRVAIVCRIVENVLVLLAPSRSSSASRTPA